MSALIRAISYGGGVQSTALLVLAARGQIDYPLAIFANTGDDSEHPESLRYVREVAAPYADRHGIELVEVAHKTETLYQKTMRQKGITIPMRLPSGAPAARGCTRDFKVQPIAAEIKRRGATRTDKATLALGISLDEWHRMKDSTIAWEAFDFPLIDRRMDRAACEVLIADAGLPIPSKSACWFCPYTSPARWKDRLRNEPDIFARAVKFERDVNDRMRFPVYLTARGKPLDHAITDDGQTNMFDGGTCDIGGYCFA